MMSVLRKYSKFLNKNNLKLLSRKLSTEIHKPTKQYIDIEIPVPWGKIAAKWWGPIDLRPIVCIHGWQDNCNTFNGLIPLLPNQSYLAIDYPGHGLSSQIPHGMFYYPSDFPLILRRIHKYFGWPQMSILAHSLAANLSCLYASIYPNDVDFFIAIDGIKPYSKEPGTFIDKMAINIDKFLKYDAINSSNVEPPSYTLDVIAKKMYDANLESIDMDKCEELYKRNTKPSLMNPGKYFFTRDNRLKAGSIICWQNEDLKEYMKRVKCPMITIRTVRSRFVEKEKYLKEAVEIMKAHNPNFTYVEFDGKHHAHLNEPEKMAVVVNKFLAKYDTEDRKLGGIQTGLMSSND